MTLSMKKCMSTGEGKNNCVDPEGWDAVHLWLTGTVFCVFIARQGTVLRPYLIKSFMTSPAIIRPATDGTNEMLAGI